MTREEIEKDIRAIEERYGEETLRIIAVEIIYIFRANINWFGMRTALINELENLRNRRRDERERDN